jgi:DNA-binding IclR family transcriptional regulator
VPIRILVGLWDLPGQWAKRRPHVSQERRTGLMDADTDGNGATKLVKSAARVADILELLAVGGEDYSVTEISKRLGIPKSSSHGLLNTLQEKGIISRDARGCYSLSLGFLAMAGQAFNVFDIRKSARPALERLSRQFNATANLAVLDGRNVVYIEKVQDSSQRTIQLVTYVGGSLPAHATALGKALVAELPDHLRDQWLSEHEYLRVTPSTVTTREAMEAELDRTRACGYAVDDEESHPSVLCVAAPVFDHTGAAIAAMSVTGIKMQLIGDDEGQVKVLGDAVRTTADSLSKSLGAPVLS